MSVFYVVTGDDVMAGRKKKDRKGSDGEEEVFEIGEDGQLRKVMRKKGDKSKDDDEESIYEYVRKYLCYQRCNAKLTAKS